MPAAPELGDRARRVGQPEIARKREAEREPEPDRHVGIAGEVEIDLDGVGAKPEPGLRQSSAVATLSNTVSAIRETSSAISTFCASPMTKMRKPAEARPSVMRRAAELARDGVIADDRAGHELRKHRDIDRDLQRIAVGGDLARDARRSDTRSHER